MFVIAQEGINDKDRWREFCALADPEDEPTVIGNDRDVVAQQRRAALASGRVTLV